MPASCPLEIWPLEDFSLSTTRTWSFKFSKKKDINGSSLSGGNIWSSNGSLKRHLLLLKILWQNSPRVKPVSMKGTAPSSQHLIPFLARFSQTSPRDLPSWVMVLMSGKDEMIRSPFFWSQSIGDFALCVNGKVYMVKCTHHVVGLHFRRGLDWWGEGLQRWVRWSWGHALVWW